MFNPEAKVSQKQKLKVTEGTYMELITTSLQKFYVTFEVHESKV